MSGRLGPAEPRATDRLRVFDGGSVRLESRDHFAFVTARDNVYLCANAYYDGTSWLRYDETLPAAVLYQTGGDLVRLSAGAGTGPIGWAVKTLIGGGLLNADQLGGVAAAQYKHLGNDGAGSGLDADLLDGIDSARVIYGANGTGTTTVTSFNAIAKSGFYDGYNATGAPTGNDWYHVIHNEHSAGGYSLQLAMLLTVTTSTSLYTRVKVNGVWAGWYANL